MTGPPGAAGSDQADVAREVLRRVGGLHPAVAEDAPVTKVPGVEEPWLTVDAERVTVDLVVDQDALPALARLLDARDHLADAFGRAVELRVVDVVERPPDAPEERPTDDAGSTGSAALP
ncbi:hypothetical protein LX15_001745 [Streptoalloteichus tenebrarius]|uniref:Asp23/Gls24 family envelope stress response protein n=1 Tax=Streptoalloteichus tenebrarius (strain ATCC 17920 / DSM 40477 / JCM 4838 / CBS 697.72 / NBRC 16177 / NCIMB 11028 / NRRL B-12390 / A12253. 1 / ISP 5477) TaxID=1933 RepID=A0ABT1HRB7_STRSD|nr:hypothetical protein [Streptoalloteichus tenebrarius]MCP2258058.1 hypothetical protein [Streptoalloteichus tenebrarius]BFF01729.1 hypothetical protein GCM10020241_34040 [Streptoalloteichus tenebrarius]